MTTYSRNDLATRILKDLSLIGAEETASAVDIEWAEETIASVTAALATKGIMIWNGSDQSLPLEYLVPLSKRIALDLAPSFGLMTTEAAEIAKPIMDMELRKMNAKQPTGLVVEAEHF